MKKFVWLPVLFLLCIGCETSGQEEIPLPPTELKATVVSTNQVDLSWKLAIKLNERRTQATLVR